MPKRAYRVTYTVTLDQDSGRWNVARNGTATGAFAMQRDTAIGSAYGAASKEQAQTLGDVRVYSVDGKGRRKQEWPTT